ncbi:protocadherin gamma-A10-like [Clinocottus analis]|uniref:protocadherin gamma-A10-like n=1 Tax=Clinocottus analis TaxID=304258 RepID=UPI0035C22B22
MAFGKSPFEKGRLNWTSVWLFTLLCLCLNDIVSGQIRYAIPEELKKGSLIGNVAQDLGLDAQRLRSGRARIVTRQSIQYTELKTDKGVLVVNEKIDREQLCGDVTPCSFSFEVILENPMELHPLKILIQDQNDNPPQVLYPVQTGGSLVAELVPRSADVGYLVTKVVAVDVDSGQNAWLSYKLQKATERALFEVGLQNGEIRTIRQVTDKDAVKQRLTVIVEDNGQPSRSATVIVNVAVADSFPEVLSEFTDFTQDKEYNDNLTFYLVLALAVVSFLFITCLVVIISVKIYRWRQSRVMYSSNLPVIPYYPPRYSDTLGTGTGTLQHVYNYEVCRTTDSRKSDCKFSGAGSQNVLIMDPSSTGTMQRIQSERSILDEPDSPLEQNSNVDGVRFAVMILQKPLDRELNPHLSLKLIAVDGGTPQRSVRSFDYEQIKQLVFTVKAQDGGSPPLSSNVTVKVLIQDQNDNPPQKATDRALFEVGLQNGEIRTIRQVTDKDAVKQRLTVIVEDNGQPSHTLGTGTGTLQHVYNYEVCRTTDSRKSDCKFSGAGSQNVLIMDPSSTGTMQRIQSERSILDEPDSPLECFQLTGTLLTRLLRLQSSLQQYLPHHLEM